MLNEHQYVDELIGILPYIKRLSGRIIIIKYGGSAMLNKTLKEHVINDLVFFSCIGLRPILIHGGGKTIDFWLKKLDIQPLFKDGVRVTDDITMQVAEMVLAGNINKELVTLVNVNGGNAIGICGKDGGLALAQPLNMKNMGFVGNIVNINTEILSLLIKNSYIPIIASVGYDQLGQTYNINADLLASRIAIALNAEKLIFLTDMPGILSDVNNASTLIQTLDVTRAGELEKEGIISGGMIPKVHSCIDALNHGVTSACIIDGRVSHSLLSNVLTGRCSGSTLINSKNVE